MRKRNTYILSALMCVLSLPAFAGWQYDGVYVGDGWYTDDGSRFVISARGGASFGMAKIQNDAGAISSGFHYDENNNTLIPDDDPSASAFPYAGRYELSDVPANKDMSNFAFAAGASIGWTVPNATQWRIEAGWDHIVKSEYNASPMFNGTVTLQDGEITPPISLDIKSGSVNSEITTDIVSIMAFYDFYDGLYKPARTVIPYVGFGIGYADSKTVLNLSDPYGDIAYQQDLSQYGEIVDINGVKMIEFYKSERHTSNFAGLLSAGISYGITEKMFLDFGARLMYIPRVKWGLTNADDTKHREFFSAENLFYANVMLGIRFEF